MDHAGQGPLVDCGAGNNLSQSFADIAGLVDVSFLQPRFSTATDPWTLAWAQGGYNNLYGVARSGFGSSSGSQARIDIRSINPNMLVTLDSFYLGGGNGQVWSTTVKVFALNTNSILFTYNGLVGNPNNTASLFAPNVSAPGGIRIEWQDESFHVGIDRIGYSVTAVPEPTSTRLFLCGMALLAVAARSTQRGARPTAA